MKSEPSLSVTAIKSGTDKITDKITAPACKIALRQRGLVGLGVKLKYRPVVTRSMPKGCLVQRYTKVC
jgi:hypothetical protein